MKTNEQDCSRCLTPVSENMLKDREESPSICPNSFLKHSNAIGSDTHGGDLRDVRFWKKRLVVTEHSQAAAGAYI